MRRPVRAQLACLGEAPCVFLGQDRRGQTTDRPMGPEALREARRGMRLASELGVPLVTVIDTQGAALSADAENGGQLFGLWVRPEWRSRSVAANLVRQGARIAADQGLSQLFYWVGSDNGRAVAFASSFGFRPTDDRRPMRSARKGAEPDEEIALVLALGQDRG